MAENKPTGLGGGAGGNKSCDILKKMTMPKKTFWGKPEEWRSWKEDILWFMESHHKGTKKILEGMTGAE